MTRFSSTKSLLTVSGLRGTATPSAPMIRSLKAMVSGKVHQGLQTTQSPKYILMHSGPRRETWCPCVGQYCAPSRISSVTASPTRTWKSTTNRRCGLVPRESAKFLIPNFHAHDHPHQPALWSTVFFALNWVVASAFLKSPVLLFDKIFFFVVSDIFPALFSFPTTMQVSPLLVPLLIMVVWDFPRGRSTTYQTILCISTWSW